MLIPSVRFFFSSSPLHLSLFTIDFFFSPHLPPLSLFLSLSLLDGIPTTINCANYVYFIALEQCHQLQSQEAMNIFVKEMLNLHRGQGQDILWREQGSCPTEARYRAMVLDKTGGLFRLAVGLMQAFSENQTDYTPLLNALGLYFQIRDDYVNISRFVSLFASLLFLC